MIIIKNVLYLITLSKQYNYRFGSIYNKTIIIMTLLNIVFIIKYYD